MQPERAAKRKIALVKLGDFRQAAGNVSGDAPFHRPFDLPAFVLA